MRNFVADRKKFKAFYITFLLINIVPFINTLFITRIILAAFCLWAAGVVVFDVVKNKFASYKNTGFVLINVFFFICGLVYLFNFQNDGLYNLISLAVFFISPAVLYITGESDLKTESKLVLKAYCFVSLLLSFVSILIYFLQLQFTHTARSGLQVRLGVWENRLFGVFTSSNVGGVIMSLSLIFSVGLLILAKLKKWEKVVLVFSAVFGYWYICLSLSRGTYLSLAVALAAMVIVYKTEIKLPLVSAFLLKASVLGMVVLAMYVSIIGVRFISVKTVDLLDYMGAVNKVITGTERIEYEEDDNQMTDISNKRFAIWRASLKVAAEKQFLGVGDSYHEFAIRGEEISTLSDTDKIYIKWAKGNVHNGYLQILVDCSAFALAVFLIFLVFCLARLVRIRRKIDTLDCKWLSLFSAGAAFVVFNNLFESNFALMGANPIQAIFWFLSGAIVHFSCVEKRGLI